MPKRYLGRRGVAKLLGVKPNSISRYDLGEPEVWIDDHKGYTEEQVEEFRLKHPQRKRAAADDDS